MTNNNIDNEIQELTIKLNKALLKLQEEGNAFTDRRFFDEVFDINEELEEKLNLKNKL